MEPSTNLSSACWWLADEWGHFDRQTLYFCCHLKKKNKSTNAPLFLLVAYVKLVGYLWVGLHTSPRYHNVSHYHIHATLSYSFLLSLCGGSRLPSSVLPGAVLLSTRRDHLWRNKTAWNASVLIHSRHEQVHRPPRSIPRASRDVDEWIWERWESFRSVHINADDRHNIILTTCLVQYTDSCLCWDASNSRPTVIIVIMSLSFSLPHGVRHILLLILTKCQKTRMTDIAICIFIVQNYCYILQWRRQLWG